MFTKILIANRGEIACRVAATARRLGIRTVAVYSDADAGARHVADCDEAWHVGPPAARESYLRGDAIIEIALATGAQAIHPGYGFLSENEDFAQKVADAGLVFIGPPPSAIRAMGLKAESKRLMQAAGVPLVPGFHGTEQDPVFLAGQAQTIGYPVMIKASAGGGGKGMRIVTKPADFDAALASCKREAKNSFGDDAVLIERYVQRPRHIEIQVFGDSHGNCVSLFERDCSVQRRHQKVIEEAPAPGMTPQRRQAMGDAAVAAAKAVGYVGAGTVEFITDPDGNFWFMEMNTRLQVEHPVTEMITGLDLVEWQLRVAAGQPLPLLQHQLAINGHAIEARVYAENTDKGFLPSTGRLVHLATPPAAHFAIGAGTNGGLPAACRIDSGVRAGDTISPFYDPMIAKLIVWGADRAQAVERMRQALAGFQVVGPTTNVDFLDRLMACQSFRNADLDTGLIERERPALFPAAAPPSLQRLAQAAAAVLAREANQDDEADARHATGHSDPWAQRNGWRVNGHLVRTLNFDAGKTRLSVLAEYLPDGYLVSSADGQQSIRLSSLKLRGTHLTGLAGDRALAVSTVFAGETLHLFDSAGHLALHYEPPLAHVGEDAAEGGRLTAPMPGKLISLLVQAGTKVHKGQPVAVMEAMKMEHTLAAPSDGTVTGFRYAVGDQVPEGAQLVDFAAG